MWLVLLFVAPGGVVHFVQMNNKDDDDTHDINGLNEGGQVRPRSRKLKSTLFSVHVNPPIKELKGISNPSWTSLPGTVPRLAKVLCTHRGPGVTLLLLHKEPGHP